MFPDHNDANYSVFQMVLNRLPFLTNTPTNVLLISQITLEVMWELEACFKIKQNPPNPDDNTRVGNENLYSVLQRSIVADIVSVYVLAIQGVSGASGNSNTNTTNPPAPTFMKKAKAGSVEVEWEQFDVNSGATLSMNGAALRDMFKKQAIRKAATLGCIIDICDDCSTKAQLASMSFAQPFIVFESTDCGCCGG